MKLSLLQRTAVLGLLCGFAVAGGGACSRQHRAGTAFKDNEIAVHATLSTNRIYVGDILRLRLQVQHPADVEVTLPPITDDPQIIVQKQNRSSRRLGRNMAETEFRFELTSFALGPHTLTTNAVLGARSGATALQAPMPPIHFEVASILSETNAVLQPPKGPANWPARIPSWLWVLPMIALIAALAGWLVRRFLSKPRTILQIPPPEPAHERALRALRALKNKGWIETENAEPFYIELSAITRRYIEDRFGIRAPELTTEEFIREAARSTLLTGPQQDLIKNFLEQADLVKFARFRPARSEMTAAFEAAERMVLETMPQAPNPEDAAQ
jgi:hypothetical protein